jgi:hypothetical protein
VPTVSTCSSKGFLQQPQSLLTRQKRQVVDAVNLSFFKYNAIAYLKRPLGSKAQLDLLVL